MNILFDNIFQSAGLENILKQEPIGGSLSIGVKTNIPRLVGTYSDRICRTMIMINTCFVLSLPCKEMITKKIPTSVEIIDVPPPTSNETEEDVSISAGTTKLSKEEFHHLFHDRNLAFVSTLSKDGSPHVTPVWTEMVDDLILINTFETSAKNKHITNDKRIALSIVEQNNPFNMVSIKGKVIERTTEGADEHLKKLAKKYLGIGKYYYRKPIHKRIIIKIRPEKIMELSIHPAFYFLAYSPWNK